MSRRLKLVFEVQDMDGGDMSVPQYQVVIDLAGTNPQSDKETIQAAFVVAGKAIQIALGIPKRIHDERMAQIAAMEVSRAA